jgi:hypothetical protein
MLVLILSIFIAWTWVVSPMFQKYMLPSSSVSDSYCPYLLGLSRWSQHALPKRRKHCPHTYGGHECRATKIMNRCESQAGDCIVFVTGPLGLSLVIDPTAQWPYVYSYSECMLGGGDTNSIPRSTVNTCNRIRPSVLKCTECFLSCRRHLRTCAPLTDGYRITFSTGIRRKSWSD